jgi:hypothetical protein
MVKASKVKPIALRVTAKNIGKNIKNAIKNSTKASTLRNKYPGIPRPIRPNTARPIMQRPEPVAPGSIKRTLPEMPPSVRIDPPLYDMFDTASNTTGVTDGLMAMLPEVNGPIIKAIKNINPQVAGYIKSNSKKWAGKARDALKLKAEAKNLENLGQYANKLNETAKSMMGGDFLAAISQNKNLLKPENLGKIFDPDLLAGGKMAQMFASNPAPISDNAFMNAAMSGGSIADIAKGFTIPSAAGGEFTIPTGVDPASLGVWALQNQKPIKNVIKAAVKDWKDIFEGDFEEVGERVVNRAIDTGKKIVNKIGDVLGF